MSQDAGRERLYEELRAYVARELLEGQETGLDGQTPLLEWGVIDSLAMVGLLAFIEERFGIQVPDEQVAPEHFQTLDALTTLLTRLAPSLPGTPRDPQRVDPTASVRALESAGLRRDTVDVGGGSHVHLLRAAGPRPSWVLLPALGNPTSTFGPILRSCIGDHDAVAFDLLGFGLSTTSKTAPTYADQLEAISAAIDRAVEAPFVLVASSAGAMIAAEIARRHPERVVALCVLGFGHIEDPRAWWRRTVELTRDPAQFLRHAYFQPPSLSPPLRALLGETLSAPAYGAFLDDAAFAQLGLTFDGLKVPTLFVSGEEDRIVPRAAVEAAAARVPGSHVEWLARCGHFPQAERPQELLLLINLFLASLPPSAS